MLLREFLGVRGLKPAEFARQIGASKSYFHEVLHGDKRASLDLALRIERETEGEVSPADLDSPWRDKNPKPLASAEATA